MKKFRTQFPCLREETWARARELLPLSRPERKREVREGEDGRERREREKMGERGERGRGEIEKGGGRKKENKLCLQTRVSGRVAKTIPVQCYHHSNRAYRSSIMWGHSPYVCLVVRDYHLLLPTITLFTPSPVTARTCPQWLWLAAVSPEREAWSTNQIHGRLHPSSPWQPLDEAYQLEWFASGGCFDGGLVVKHTNIPEGISYMYCRELLLLTVYIGCYIICK